MKDVRAGEKDFIIIIIWNYNGTLRNKTEKKIIQIPIEHINSGHKLLTKSKEY